jgi:outer membrane protein OmpA-like peptidoglycan-associated protein
MLFRSHMLCKNWLFASLALMLSVFLLPTNVQAQDDSVPKYDLFVGYQWLHPGGNVPSPFATASNPVPFQIPDMAKGAGASLTYNFDRHFGVEGDFGYNWDHYESTVSLGPRLMFRSEDGAFFIHALLSYNRLGIDGLDASNGIGGVLGGGMDWKITRRVSWRVFEADYVGAFHHYPQFVPSPLARPALSGARLRTGLVFNFGFPENKPVAATVAVQPSEVMVGEPVTATASASNFNPKHNLTYNWTSTCGKIRGHDNTASVDTNGVPGGNCTVTARIVDPRQKKNGEASASSNFTVKEPPKNPPTVSCSASPTSVQAGGEVTVTCTCNSPDNVPVTVSNYTATGGNISGSGNTATLNTMGASPGTVTVNATCSDQRGLNTPATTSVAVENPPPPPPQVSPEVRELEARLALHSVYFPTAQPTTANPQGGLVRSQQQTLISLAADFKKYLESRPDAHLILEGHADPRGSAEYNQALSERRVERTKNVLIQNGVPAGNIETKAFGAQQQLAPEQVRGSVEQSTDLTPGEKQRIVRNMRTILLASNRRVDVTLSTTGQESVRQFPFNAADSLTLIGGREKPKAATKTTRPAKKKAKKKQ